VVVVVVPGDIYSGVPTNSGPLRSVSTVSLADPRREEEEEEGGREGGMGCWLEVTY